eukprot:maker-scaffold_21-snap-gene-4.39-mRNA-1 protein AED:0.00 eAED:0.00 QI:2/1/1/1/1/1/2/571/482
MHAHSGKNKNEKMKNKNSRTRLSQKFHVHFREGKEINMIPKLAKDKKFNADYIYRSCLQKFALDNLSRTLAILILGWMLYLTSMKALRTIQPPITDELVIEVPKVEQNVQNFDEDYPSPPDGEEQEEEETVEEETIMDDTQPIFINDDFTYAELFSNYEDYAKADPIKLPPKNLLPKNIKQSYPNLPYGIPRKGLWWAVLAYENNYRQKENPIKQVIPRLNPNLQITKKQFHEIFRKPAQPVIMSFSNLRSLNFTTESFALSELRQLFPYDQDENQLNFAANGRVKTDEEIDLAPALAAIERDEKLTKKGNMRSFPRNLKVKPEAIKKLNVQKPPLVLHEKEGDNLWQMPTLWMGTSSADTRFHHDCCDNFVMMLSGTKRFTLAPPTDWRVLNPQCIGKLKNLCWASVNNPNLPNEKFSSKERRILQHVNKIVVDVGPGEILYMPAGWFHHIQNLGPTVMVNWWTKGKETCALIRAKNSPLY